MTATIEELGRRAVGCKYWEWLPGMRDTSDRRILAEYETHTTIGIDGSVASFLPTADCYSYTLRAPDLSDRATLALLRDIVAQAYDGVECRVRTTAEPKLNGSYFVDVIIEDNMGRTVKRLDLDNIGAELWVVESLVCALEAAPGVP